MIVHLEVRNFIYICMKPGVARDLESINKQDNLFRVIFARGEQIPDRFSFENSQSIEIRENTIINAKTINHCYLDSKILRIVIVVKYERVDENQNNEMLLPEMMVRPIANTNTDELDLFGDDDDELGLLTGDFVSYNG